MQAEGGSKMEKVWHPQLGLKKVEKVDASHSGLERKRK
jgi:hypothetical protein